MKDGTGGVGWAVGGFPVGEEEGNTHVDMNEELTERHMDLRDGERELAAGKTRRH